MAWYSNFTVAVFLLHSACLTPLVLQGINCALLASQTLLPWASLFSPLCLALCFCFVSAGMHWLHSAPQYETMRLLAPLQHWVQIAFLSVMSIYVMDVSM